MEPIFSYSFSALQPLSCIILCVLSLLLLSSLSSHSSLSANAGATFDSPVHVSIVKIPGDSTTSIKTFFVSNILLSQNDTKHSISILSKNKWNKGRE